MCTGADVSVEYSSKYPKNSQIILDDVIIFDAIMVKLGVHMAHICGI